MSEAINIRNVDITSTWMIAWPH